MQQCATKILVGQHHTETENQQEVSKDLRLCVEPPPVSWHPAWFSKHASGNIVKVEI